MQTDNTQHHEPPVLAVVVPCFNEEAVVEETASRLTAVLSELIGNGAISPGSFVYFVDDGSRDGTWSLIANIHRRDPRVKGLKLSRNFGHQNAILAGLLAVKDRAAVPSRSMPTCSTTNRLFPLRAKVPRGR